ncbi:helix-turn-helix domain-containing protein [Chitinophaga sp. 22321]|uniref:Helix-turn-helix transcriptional regulator n=1 Tax=Chitinophaga hostae TaxID=2831022 RepID=A0ABS5JBR5_9BACT|nr:helix-turn-helix domain-containing protein [Chitinophaga hostae]MBS0032042.1 helix-turn-helix transcriptional regulator [Chitinophaga hostae]
MIIDDYPATIKFSLSTKSDVTTESSPLLPLYYRHNALKGAFVTYTAGDFGCFSTQEIRHENWVMGWLNFSINDPVTLAFTTDQPMVALICTLKGKVAYELPGYGSFTLQRGRYGFYYIPPQMENKVLLAEDEHNTVYFSFSAVFLSSFAEQHANFQELYTAQQNAVKTGNVFPVFKIGIEERRILDAIRNSNLAGPAKHIFLQARINDLLVSYFSSLETTDQGQLRVEDQQVRFREIELFIQENYHLPLKMQFLSRKAGMNLRSFEKGFKGYFGVKAKEYIEQLRVKLATDLLKNSDMPITAIAYHVGFAGTNYFSFVFRKIQHCSPREYRQRNEGKKMDKGEFL